MSGLEYHRPQTLAEAVDLLRRGQVLAGGTRLAAKASALRSVVDIQAIGLDRLEEQDGYWLLGAGLRLQSIVESVSDLPAALVEACRREAGLNLRNMATVGGTIVTCDGRSPFVTSLLAMDARLTTEPGGRTLSLDDYLDSRRSEAEHNLIISVGIRVGTTIEYEQVARSPGDRPIVCAAAAQIPGRGRPRIALGGFGARPVMVEDAHAAEKAYSRAEDAWASAVYRSAVAEVLVRRLTGEEG